MSGVKKNFQPGKGCSIYNFIMRCRLVKLLGQTA